MHRRMRLDGLSPTEIRRALETEDGAFYVVIMNLLDDVKPILTPEHAQRLVAFEQQFWTAAVKCALELSELINQHVTKRTMEFAAYVAQPHPAGPTLYTAFKNAQFGVESVLKVLLRQLRFRATSPADVRRILDAPLLAWAPADQPPERAPMHPVSHASR